MYKHRNRTNHRLLMETPATPTDLEKSDTVTTLVIALQSVAVRGQTAMQHAAKIEPSSICAACCIRRCTTTQCV